MASCYYKANTKSVKTAPCNHTALDEGKHTQCCEPGDLCLTNGLCREETVNNITNYAWRFGCTDKDFKDPSCGTDYCDKIPGSDNHLTWKCPEDNIWCCNTGDAGPYEGRVNRTNTTCCTIEDLKFTALNPVVFATASFYGSMFPVGTMLPSSRAVSNATSSTISATTTPSTSAISITPSTSANAVAATGTSTLAIGLGAGIGSFAAIALGIGSFLLYRRRKRTPESPRSTTPAKELSDLGLVEVSSRDVAEMTTMEYRTELTSPVSPVELWTPTERAELPGDEKGRSVIGEFYSHPKP